MAKPPNFEENKLPVPLPELVSIPVGKPRSVGMFRALAERTSITVTVDIKLHLVIGALTTLVLAIVAAIHA